ncbi:MAG: thioredoxin [Deltaproteobacteria bacterium]|nr:thioredoxin [Deltaproteobacteria bacterium]
MSEQIQNVDEKDFESKVMKSDVPVLVDFWAPWCGPCRIVGPVLESLAKEHGGVIKVVKVNVDDNPSLASRFGVRGIPTVVLVDGGTVRETVVGARPRADFEGMIGRSVGVAAG